MGRQCLASGSPIGSTYLDEGVPSGELMRLIVARRNIHHRREVSCFKQSDTAKLGTSALRQPYVHDARGPGTHKKRIA